MLSTNVVSANAARPKGPGSAIGLGTNETRCASVPADGSCAPLAPERRGSEEASMTHTPCPTGDRRRARAWAGLTRRVVPPLAPGHAARCAQAYKPRRGQDRRLRRFFFDEACASPV